MKVFLSSTLLDLEEYRQAVFNVAHTMGWYTDDMSYWPASDSDAVNLSTERVRHCDAMVLAHRYGYVPPNYDCSITELEYRAARECKIPIYAFSLDDNTPWPPALIEWEKREELASFKERIKAELTMQIFTSPEMLATKVAQALATYRERYAQDLGRKNRFKGRAANIETSVHLRTKPDVLISIGYAEDGLPLLLRVRRGRELRDLVSEMDAQYDLPASLRQSDAFVSFKRSLEDLASNILAEDRIRNVRTSQGSSRDMYVTPQTLSDLFQSAFGTIVQAMKVPAPAGASGSSAPKDPAPPRRRQNTARIALTESRSYGHVVLQSVGGENRFLGVSPLEGTLYSVGKQDEEWVEWHPFLLETLTVYFPEYSFILFGSSGKQQGKKREYREALLQLALDSVAVDGKLPIDVFFEFSRQSVGRLILKISKSLVDFHNRGLIHGDLKPSNIILAPHRPELMDHFNLSEGNISPG